MTHEKQMMQVIEVINFLSIVTINYDRYDSNPLDSKDRELIEFDRYD